MNRRLDRTVPHVLFPMLMAALLSLGLVPAEVSAQSIEAGPPVLADFPVQRSVAAFPAWEDRSDELPGISSGSTILIAAGVVAVGAIVYFALRSDDDEEESGENEGTGGSTNLMVPSLLVDVDDVGLGAASPRWRMGVSWVF